LKTKQRDVRIEKKSEAAEKVLLCSNLPVAFRTRYATVGKAEIRIR
jgi:hypothetical protein